MGETTLKHLPLEDLHIAAGARFGAFAGWNMPLTYPLGVMKEHIHTREQAGLFDISHMRLIELTGDGAASLLNALCPIDVTLLNQGQSKYTFFLNEAAGILDDIIITRLGDNRYVIVANASNADADIAYLQSHSENYNCTIHPLDRVLLALQGPLAAELMQNLGIDISTLRFMHGIEPKSGWFITRSGYTGEDGFEIALPIEQAHSFAQKLLSDERVAWVGLAARDSLRLEAGLCLHGQDITDKIDPASAGLTWTITKAVREKGDFNGAPALMDILAKGPQKRRVGIRPEGRQPVRAGTILFDDAGNIVGEITSGGFGPTAGIPVAMGYVHTEKSPIGTPLFAEIRGSKAPVTVHSLPFIQHRYHKG